MQTQQPLFPHWMRGVLLLMVPYHVLWGVFITWFSDTFYQWVTQSEMDAPGIIFWQGRAVLFMALVYLIAALHPARFWYLMLLGALTKLAGGIWFYFSILDQQVGDKALFHLIMNDAVWIPLLLVIMFRARQYRNQNGL